MPGGTVISLEILGANQGMGNRGSKSVKTYFKNNNKLLLLY